MLNSQTNEPTILSVRKRDGSVMGFDQEKISNAIYKAMFATSNPDRGVAEQLTRYVVEKLLQQGFSADRPPSVETIQDMVETTLIERGHSEIAKAYILYRHERRKVREEKMRDPQHKGS